MITFLVKANVKPGQLTTLKEALLETAAFISKNEPEFANYAYFSADETQVTFINLINDSAALAHHFAIAPQNEAGAAMMRALEITVTEIYGELSPEVEEMVHRMNPARRTTQIGTFDRAITVKEGVVA